MRVLVAGATGAVGRQLIPALVQAGHQVTAASRSQARLAGLRAAGAEPALLDGLDARVPAWLGRLLVGEAGISMMTQIRGISSVRARRELGWEPAYASWRDGFARGLGREHQAGVAAAAGARDRDK